MKFGGSDYLKSIADPPFSSFSHARRFLPSFFHGLPGDSEFLPPRVACGTPAILDNFPGTSPLSSCPIFSFSEKGVALFLCPPPQESSRRQPSMRPTLFPQGRRDHAVLFLFFLSMRRGFLLLFKCLAIHFRLLLAAFRQATRPIFFPYTFKGTTESSLFFALPRSCKASPQKFTPPLPVHCLWMPDPPP